MNGAVYLFQNTWGWLLVATILGLFVGWSTWAGLSRKGWLAGWAKWGAIIFVVGAVVALLKLFPGRWGLWVETALWFGAVYIAGCFVGGWLRAWLGMEASATPIRTTTVAAVVGSPSVEIFGHDTVASYPGVRPPGLALPKGRADDLKLIEGMGPLNEKFCNEIGVHHYSQVAGWKGEHARWFDYHLGRPGFVGQMKWIEQAKLLADGKGGAAAAGAVGVMAAAATAGATVRSAPTPAAHGVALADADASARATAARKIELERHEAIRTGANKAEAERGEFLRRAAAKAEADRAEVGRLAAVKAEAERAEAARQASAADAARAATAKAEADRAEAARLVVAKAEAERVEAARLATVRAEAERAEAERLAAAEAARLVAAKADAERAEVARRASAEATRLAAVKAETERAEAARLAAAKAEAERVEAARLVAAKAEAERAEAARLAAAKAEAERVEAARLAAVKADTERAEAARLATAKAEAERAEAMRRAAAEAAAKAEAERAAATAHPGARPAALALMGADKGDDLKWIKGIGPKNEKICNELGVYRFRQIADWKPENATWVGHHVRFPGRIEREHWIPQAQLLSAGLETDHSIGVKSGRIPMDESADAPLSEADAAAFQKGMPQMAAKVEGEEKHGGSRPVGLLGPRGGKADNLKLISGIGKQNEARLHGLGIWHFDQIAAWKMENVKWAGSYLAFPGRIDREQWVSQARDLAAGRQTEFARRAAAGLVKTSADDGTLGQGNVAIVSPKG